MGGGYQEKGRRPGPGHAGRGALLDDVLHWPPALASASTPALRWGLPLPGIPCDLCLIPPSSGEKAPGPARAARGSPPTPPQFHGRTTGLSRIPKGWRTAEIITSTTSARDRAAVPTTARSGRMGGCVMPPHRSMRHRHALTFPSDRRPLRVP